MSIRKRKWTTSKGEWKEAWVVDYVDQAAKRRLKSFQKKKDADAFQATAKVEVREGTHTAHSQSKTVADSGGLWIRTGEKNGLERTTIDAYRQHLDVHINPYLGRRKLSELTVPMIRAFEDSLQLGKGPDGSETPPRSAALTKKIIRSLGSLLADAQERGHVNRNVVRELRGRRTRSKERHAERRQRGKLKVGVDIPTPNEIRSIVRNLDGQWRPILLTAIFAGLRASELRGLRWHDVDLDNRQVHVRQRADKYNTMGPPKSEAGERVVPLPPILVNTLGEWKLACPKSDLDLVFPTGSGHIEYHTNIVRRGLQPAQVKAGVIKARRGGRLIAEAKYPGLHAFRHFFASWLINRKADGGLELPPKVVQERLGHASIQMTMDVYGHLFPRGDDSAELAEAELRLLG
jgi:integrase